MPKAKRSAMRKWTRRAFIGAGSLVGGGFVLGIGGVIFSPSRHSVVSADAEEKGELTTWITVTPDNLVTILVSALRNGTGGVDGAGDDGGRGDGGRLGPGPDRRGAGPRHVCQRVHPPCVRGRCRAGPHGTGRRLWLLPAGAVVRLAGHGRFDGRPGHGALRHAPGRRRRQGDAARGGGGAVRGRRIGLRGDPVSGDACRLRPECDLRRVGEGSGGEAGAPRTPT